ncbi:MAG: M48 family metalloprotease [Armatimonadetes bacterium]|nr:M48 family metalloprotease [Armatimonadota bacterium]PIU64120.1 MAG: hypothetical protein COS85_13700 [Armatimonadetes bacterium CG07_land_8_20_14_0_80_59_28]PIY45660.1 MAG: hypothetical protein COZ05_06345 [Armatimonadetes bacterium CG_4_10_14_3_um_filter_59_10]PJB78679.1 MAG: hypothetical protein CO095_00245 [Armatimonadetes bacterium CG_4_9_14_3_um_filter_58_7]
MTRETRSVLLLILAVLVLCPARPVRAGLFDLSWKDEQKIGEDMIRELKKEYDIYQDWEITAIGEVLAKASDYPDRVAEFWVFPDPSYNAFALPGGHIMITEGLLEALETQDEIAFILGHEITHAAQRHIASEVKRSRENSALASLLLIAVGANTTWWRVGDFFNFAVMNQYSQKKERAADDGGYSLTTHAGFDPEAAVSSLAKLREKYGDGPKAFNKLFGTHPLLRSREKRIEKRLDRAPTDTPAPEIVPPTVETGLPMIEVKLLLTEPKLRDLKKKGKADESSKFAEPDYSWDDEVGKQFQVALTTALDKSEKLVILRQWQLVRPDDRPRPDFTLTVTSQEVVRKGGKEKPVTSIDVSARLVDNRSNSATWERDYAKYDADTHRREKGKAMGALSRDIAIDVSKVLVGETLDPAPK